MSKDSAIQTRWHARLLVIVAVYSPLTFSCTYSQTQVGAQTVAQCAGQSTSRSTEELKKLGNWKATTVSNNAGKRWTVVETPLIATS